MVRSSWRILVAVMALAAVVSGPWVPGTDTQAAATGVRERAAPAKGLPHRPSRTEADAPYVEGELIVRYKPGIQAAAIDGLRARNNLRTKRVLARGVAEVVEIGRGQSVASVLSALQGSGLVDLVQPNFVYRAEAVPTDSFWPFQWGLQNDGQVISGGSGIPDVDIDAPDGWPYLEGRAEVVVAVVDTGVEIDHEDLVGKIWVNSGEIPDNGLDDDGNGYVDDVHGWNFFDQTPAVYLDPVEDEHGTHVAGIIAASRNSVGIAGVAPNVRIMVLKVLGPGGMGTTEALVEAVYYAAANGADLINASLGTYGEDPLLYEALAETGILMVAAAGNDATDTDTTPHYPSAIDLPNIISVASVTNAGALSHFSNYGAVSVDVGAPGSDIVSTLPTFPPLEDPGAAIYHDAQTYATLFLGIDLAQVAEADQASLMAGALATLGYEAPDPVSILLVNDAEYDPDLTSLYESALNTAGFHTIAATTIPQDGDGPDLAELQQHDLVVWFTGTAYGHPGAGITTLTQTDMANLTAYLNGGGKLLLAGEDALYLNEESEFTTAMLGVIILGEAGYFGALTGVAGTLFEGSGFAIADTTFGTSEYSDLVAPAVETAQTVLRYTTDLSPGRNYGYLSGTSMAAPHVSGVLAAALSAKNLTPAEAIHLVMETGKPLFVLEGTTVSGKMVNLAGALATAVFNPGVAVSPAQIGQPAAYTITFTTGPWGRLVKTADRSDTITIAFPADVILPAEIPAGLVTVNGTPVGAESEILVPEGSTLTLPAPVTIDHNSLVTVVVDLAAGIINPGAEGFYQARIATSTDPVLTEAPAFYIGSSLTLDAPQYRGIGAQDVAWDNSPSFIRRKAQVTLEAPSLNADASVAEQIPAAITSESDPTGILIWLEETGPDTGLFTGSFGFAPASDEAAGLIAVGADGESVRATAVGLSDTAFWYAAEESLHALLLHGAFSYDAAALTPSDLRVTLLKADDGTALAGEVDTVGFAGGTGRYAVLVGPASTGDYVAVLHADGYAANTGVIALPGDTTDPVTYQIAGEWVDAYGFPLEPLALAPDQDPPAAPAVSNLADGTTLAVSSLNLEVSAEPFSLVALQVDGSPVGSVQAAGDGSARFSLHHLTDGNHNLILTAEDLAGNESPSTALSFRVDTIPLTLSVEPVHAAMTTVAGETKPGAAVTVLSGPEVLGTASAGGAGQFAVTIAAQPGGTVLTVRADDTAGRVHSESLIVWPAPTPALSDLTVSGESLAFDPAITRYTVRVGPLISSVTVTATPANPWVQVSIGGHAGTSRTVDLAYGANTVTVVASLGPDESTAYRLTITREQPASPPPPGGGGGSVPGGGDGSPGGSPSGDEGEASPGDQGQGSAGDPGADPPSDEGDDPADDLNQDGAAEGAAGTVTLTPSHLEQIGRGTAVTLALPEPAGPTDTISGAVVVPADLLQQMAANQNSLAVLAGRLRIQVSAKALQQAVGTGSVSIGVSVLEPEAAATELPAPVRAAFGAAPSQGLMPSGPVLTITVQAMDRDGAVTPVTHLGDAWELVLPYAPDAASPWLAVYWLNPATRAWEYVGGDVDAKNRVVVARIDHFSEFAVFAYTREFADVPSEHWAYDVIQAMAARQIVKGVTPTTFSPSARVTRAEFATLLVRALNLPAAAPARPTFADVSPADWFYDDVERATRAGLIQGENGRFRPNDPITRQEMAVMAIRAMGLKGPIIVAEGRAAESALAPYADADQVGSWARGPVATAIQLGLTTGRSAREYAPTASTTRAEAVMLLHRILLRLEKR